MLPATSPFYLFAALDVNAKIREGRVGVGWAEALSWVLSRARLFLRAACSARLSRPVVDGKLWRDYPTSVLASDRRFQF